MLNAAFSIRVDAPNLAPLPSRISPCRLFEFLQANGVTTPVIHHHAFPAGATK